MAVAGVVLGIAGLVVGILVIALITRSVHQSISSVLRSSSA